MQLVRSLSEPGPAQGATEPSQTSISDTAGVILYKNPKRKGFSVQNTGLTTIKLTFGATLPTQTVYHVSLKACTVANDGSGGYYVDDCWIGPVGGISSVAGGTCVVTEFSANSPDWDLNADWGLPAKLVG